MNDDLIRCAYIGGYAGMCNKAGVNGSELLKAAQDVSGMRPFVAQLRRGMTPAEQGPAVLGGALGKIVDDVERQRIDDIKNFLSRVIAKGGRRMHHAALGAMDVNPRDAALMSFAREQAKAAADQSKPSVGIKKRTMRREHARMMAGEDIGKKGPQFGKIKARAKASGARDPEAVAAAAMWRGIRSRQHSK